MVPHYQNRHERQAVGLEGPDLAGNRRRQLFAGARGTPRDSIQQFDSTQFHVASESCPGSYYEIDLNRSTCNCRDFPRIRFCKHLAAIYVYYFPHLCTEPSPPKDPGLRHASNASQRVPNPDVRRSLSSRENLQRLLQEIKSLSQELNDKIQDDVTDAAVMEAVRSVKYSLTAALASTQGSRALPNREVSPPNQNSWTATAERMVWKRAPKRRRPDEYGITERSIGASKGKRNVLHTDAYAGGERSGKRAKPDALSAEANVRARAPPPIPPPPNALPFPSALPHASPFAYTPDSIACAPGPSTGFPGAFALPPNPSTAHASPPGAWDLHAPGDSLTCLKARD